MHIYIYIYIYIHLLLFGQVDALPLKHVQQRLRRFENLLVGRLCLDDRFIVPKKGETRDMYVPSLHVECAERMTKSG